MQPFERVEKVLNHLKISANRLAKEIGLPDGRPQRIYDLKKKDLGISADLARKITDKYPQISYDWLVKEEGEMLLSENHKNGGTMDETDKDLIHTISLLRTELASKDRELKTALGTIRSHEETISDLRADKRRLQSQLDQEAKKRDQHLEDGGSSIPARRH